MITQVKCIKFNSPSKQQLTLSSSLTRLLSTHFLTQPNSSWIIFKNLFSTVENILNIFKNIASNVEQANILCSRARMTMKSTAVPLKLITRSKSNSTTSSFYPF